MMIGENSSILAGYRVYDMNPVYNRHNYYLRILDTNHNSVKIKIKTIADIDYLHDVLNDLAKVMEEEVKNGN